MSIHGGIVYWILANMELRVPFWGALWYSYIVRRDDSGFQGEGIRGWW